MHWNIIPTKQTDDVIITTTNILWEIDYKKTAPFLIIDQIPAGYHIATNYQIATAIST